MQKCPSGLSACRTHHENSCGHTGAACLMNIGSIEPDHVYICCGHTDMRKAIDGLVAIVEHNFNLSPFENNLFLFCGKRRDRIKGLLWRGDGFLLLYKRLDNGRFAWPKNPGELVDPWLPAHGCLCRLQPGGRRQALLLLGPCQEKIH